MEKQIEEIGKTMCRSFGTDDCVPCDAHRVCMIRLYAEDVCKAGYRRASDVAEEIFAGIMQAIEKGVAEAKEKVTNSAKDFAFREVLLHTGELYAGNIGKDICEVFKKYEQEK